MTKEYEKSERLFALIIQVDEFDFDFKLVRASNLAEQIINECYCYVHAIDKRLTDSGEFCTSFHGDLEPEDISDSNWQFSGLLYVRPIDEWNTLGGNVIVWMQDKSGNWEGYDPVDWSTWKKEVKTGAYNDIAAYHEPVQECL